MKKMRKTKVITALALTMVMLVAMTGIAAAEDSIRFHGYITEDGSGASGVPVEIKNSDGVSIGTDTTSSDGYYTLPSASLYTEVADRNDDYTLYINGIHRDTRTIEGSAWSEEAKSKYDAGWSYQWDFGIPEFTTIAIPVAGILGLVLFFNHRKHKKE